MNGSIINNLYEFWEQIGDITNNGLKTNDFNIVSMGDSDWPNRIFNIKDRETIAELIHLCNLGKAPEIIAIPKPNELGSILNLELLMTQSNMALKLELFSKPLSQSLYINRVESKEDAYAFAITASNSFDYKVDPKIINQIRQKSKSIRLYLFQDNKVNLGCGIIFFDSNNIAGLHMIGTLPEGRGKGIGKRMTEHLIMQAKAGNAKTCVLHASQMGKPIYKKLGFKDYGELETYRILKQNNIKV